MPIIGINRSRGLHLPSHPRILRHDHPLARGLVGAYFPGPSPLHWVDLTGRRLGTPDNSSGDLTARAQNDFGALTTMFSGDATNDRITLGSVAASDPLALAGRTELTILAWVHRTADSGTFSRIIDKSDGSNGQNGWAFYLSSTGNQPFFNVNFGSTAQSHEAGFENPVPLNKTTLIGYSMHALDDGRFYQDGRAVATSSNTQKPIPAAATNAAIGNWNHDVGRMWEGEILGVMVYDRALSAAEHAQAVDPAERWGFMEPPRRFWVVPAAVTGIEASGGAVLPAPASTGAAALILDASGGSVLPAPTGTGSVSLILDASGAAGLPTPTGTGNVSLILDASGGAALPAPVSTGSVSLGDVLSASGGSVLPAPASTGTAALILGASGGTVLPAPVSTGAGALILAASGAGLLPAPVSAGAADLPLVASGGAALPAPVSAGAADVILTASGATALRAPVSTGAGIVGDLEAPAPITPIEASLISSLLIEARRGMTRDNPLQRHFNISPLTLAATVKTAAGGPQPLDGYSFRWELAEGDARQALGAAAETLTSATGQIVVTDAAAGAVEVRAPASVFADRLGLHRWQLIATDPSGQPWVVATGQLWLGRTL